MRTLFSLVNLAFTFLVLVQLASAESSSPAFAHTMKIGNTAFVPLINVCLEQGIEIDWDGVTNKVVLMKDSRYVTFMADEPLVNVDGVVRAVDRAPVIMYGTFLIPESISDSHWWPWKGEGRVEAVPAFRKDIILNRVMLDPGHGGHDAGAEGLLGIREKDLVLDLARQLAQELRRAGLEVFLTRQKDEFIPLERRAEMVSEFGADLFLSLHANATKDHRVHGFETYFLSEAIDDYARAVAAYENTSLEVEKSASAKFLPLVDPTVWDIILSEQRQESVMLAKMISTSLGQSKLALNRGVKGAEFKVLMNSRAPALLIETGFITNLEEARQLMNPNYQRQMVLMITEAILEYKEEYERSRGFTI